MKDRLITTIKSLLQEERCSLAVLFGSFLSREDFRDIDLMVAMEGGRRPDMEELVHIRQLLERATGHKVDVVGIDLPDILLRAEIARNGRPILVRQEGLWEEFCIRALIDEMDFRPLIESYYAERFGVEQR